MRRIGKFRTGLVHAPVVSANADAFVTGGKALLELREINGMPKRSSGRTRSALWLRHPRVCTHDQSCASIADAAKTNNVALLMKNIGQRYVQYVNRVYRLFFRKRSPL